MGQAVTDRVRAFRRRHAQQGETRVEVRVPAGKAEAVRRYARALRDGPPPNLGPFATEEHALAALRDRLVAALDPEAIYLVGSRARGDHRPDSDFDLIVVHRGREEDLDFDAAYAPVTGLGVGVDVIPVALADFDIERRAVTGLLAEAMKEARLIHERPRP